MSIKYKTMTTDNDIETWNEFTTVSDTPAKAVRAMGRSIKMGLIVLIGVCVLFYQYHLSTRVNFYQVPEFNTADELTFNGSGKIIDDFSHQKITEETIRLAVKTVQEARGLSPEVGSLLVHELLNEFNRSNEGTRVKSSSVKTTTPSITTTIGSHNRTDSSIDPLYIITPTYRRPEQVPELTRMSHTLMLVRNVHWLVIEDAKVPTPQVTKLLNRTGLAFEHLVAPMPDKYKTKKGAKPRGVSNRNRGLRWIRANATRGVFYFADDDNTYDIDLFDEIRRTKKVSMFPVGLCTKFGMSSPVVSNGTFLGFYDGWVGGRKFPVDMAGFAVSVNFLTKRPNASMPYTPGYEEDGFLKSLKPFEPKEIELLADNCTRILAWHTQTKKNEPGSALNMTRYRHTNLAVLKQQIV